MSDADDLATFGVDYLDRVLAAEHDGFVRAEEKVAKYAQALALIVTTAALGASHFQMLREATAQLSGWDRLFLLGYVVGAVALLTALAGITASVIVEDTPGMPADEATGEAFKAGNRLDVTHEIIDRYVESIEKMRVVNKQKFRRVDLAMWATYVTLICALVALAGYVFQ
jgi:hypothetical protein